MAAVDSRCVADLGEDALLAAVFPLLPEGADTVLGPGDDAAVVAAADARVVISTDVLVEGRHFRTAWSSGADVGWRAAMANLADIAAMGARPTALVVALVLPGATPVAWVTDLAAGLAAACEPHGVGVVGGDLSGGEQVVVSITALGDLGGSPPVLRSGARAGDVVVHAGVRGRSAAGLALLDAGAPGDDALVAAYLRPSPPVGAGVVASRGGATAMIDVSDGLLRDAGRLALASGVVIDLDDVAEAFADDLALLAPAAAGLGADPVVWLLGGGEDHSLLATLPANAPIPAPFRRVGVVRSPGEHPAGAVVMGGVQPEVAPGWDHFGG